MKLDKVSSAADILDEEEDGVFDAEGASDGEVGGDDEDSFSCTLLMHDMHV